MKKAFTVFALLASFASSAFAADSYLYWMVDTSVSGDFSYARVIETDDKGFSSYLNLYYPDNVQAASDGISVDTIEAYSDIPGSGFYALLGSAAGVGYSYAIELLNDSGMFLSQSESLYVTSENFTKYVSAGGLKIPAGVWMPGSYAVPEPNSALLMALGLAAMALRRRRPVKA